MIGMQDIQEVMSFHKVMMDSHLAHVSEFIGDVIAVNINNYIQWRNNRLECGFNVFRLTSDLYYRENFHSDIIKAFLNPKENHGEGNAFLLPFIKMLQKGFHSTLSIDESDYFDAVAIREVGKIDILVYSPTSKHCIIIENKINNAPDMQRQLPRYYEYAANEKGCSVDAIVYLTLEQGKMPDMGDWSESDYKNVYSKLCLLPAYAVDGAVNLVDDWIIPASMNTGNEDCISLLRQYANLLKVLNTNVMDKVTLSKFYELLMDDNKLDSAMSIKYMLDDMPVYLASRVKYGLQKYADNLCHIWSWNTHPEHCGVILSIKGHQYKIDIYSGLNGYDVYLFSDDGDRRMDVPWLNMTGSAREYSRKDSGEYFCRFLFKDEDKLLHSVSDLIAGAKKYNTMQCENGMENK